MMDRLAALADILPPLPPAPLPPAPWWQTPLPWLALVFVLAVCVWVLLGWRRGRTWRLLRAQARAVWQRETQVPQTTQLATLLAAQLRSTQHPEAYARRLLRMALSCAMPALLVFAGSAALGANRAPWLLDWLRASEPQLTQVFVNHGEPQAARALLAAIDEQLDVCVTIPMPGERVAIA